jgi:hypothetical protein
MRAGALALFFAFLAASCSEANAATIAQSGSTVVYTAAPGESNRVLVTVGYYDTSCGSVGTPCLSVFESGARITSASGTCIVFSSNPIAGDTATCALPTSFSADLGDRDDAIWDWDGPSTIDGGAGNDNPLTGNGGDDVIRGGIGSDLLTGDDGNDYLDGGAGDDYLEGVSWVEEAVTHGRDTYVGGGGSDRLTYEGRTEDLSLSPDGVANDGAPGEGDNIGSDIATIVGGHGSDVMTGNAGANAFVGGEGNDVLTGGPGDDQLAGGPGADRLSGDAGQDVLGGDSGDDLLVGGEGIDRFWGDDTGACLAYSCSSGQDRIEARDGNREQINCGAGTDLAIGDAFDLTYDNVYSADQCESLDGIIAGSVPPAAASAPPAAPAPSFAVGGASADRKRRITVRVTAPGPGVIAVRAAAGKRTWRASRTVAAAGQTALTLKTPRTVRGRAKVKLRISFKPPAGAAPRPQTRSVKLR